MEEIDGVTYFDEEEWPRCIIPDCTNKCCLRLNSPFCYPHSGTEKLPKKWNSEKGITLRKLEYSRNGLNMSEMMTVGNHINNLIVDDIFDIEDDEH